MQSPKSAVAVNVEYATSFTDHLYPPVKEVQHQYQKACVFARKQRELSRLCILSKKKQVALPIPLPQSPKCYNHSCTVHTHQHSPQRTDGPHHTHIPFEESWY